MNLNDFYRTQVLHLLLVFAFNPILMRGLCFFLLLLCFVFHVFSLFLPSSSPLPVCFFSSFFLCLFIFREREKESKRERDRERIPSRLCAVSTEPDMGLSLMNFEIMNWAETKSPTLSRWNHPGSPPCLIFLMSVYLHMAVGSCLSDPMDSGSPEPGLISLGY